MDDLIIPVNNRRAKLKELQKQVSYCVTMDTYQQQTSSHDQRLLSLEGRVHTVSHTSLNVSRTYVYTYYIGCSKQY